ncbi:Unknown protein sequence [Pseudomonas amygdali pv. sesami]|nr:Unknown protein sequence [Pseudomonas amygdali pv. sesami]
MGVRVCGAIDNIFDWSDLNQLPRTHNSDCVSDVSDDSEVV